MRDQKKVLIKQLDRKLLPLLKVKDIQVPERGWIYSIRTTINMTLEQLGKKLNMTIQGVKDIESREASGTISLNSMREVGKALDMQFVYGFVPNFSSFEKLIDLKAKELATKIVSRTDVNMSLENQENSKEILDEAINELAIEIKREMRKSIWD